MSSQDPAGWVAAIAGVVSAVAAVAALFVSRSATPPRRDLPKLLLIATAVVALIVAIWALVMLLSRTSPESPTASTHTSPSVGTSPTTQDSPSPVPPCSPSLTLTSPSANATVRGREGTTIAGTAQCLGDVTGWLFEYDPEDHYYYAVGDDGLTITSDGNWSLLDKPIGDDGDQNKQYTVVLIQASPACADALAALPTIDDDHKHRKHPASCIVAATASIRVTY